MSDLKIIYMANIGRIILINKMLTDYYASDKIKNLQKGDIVLENNKLFYIYNIDCKKAYGFEINREVKDGDYEIIVNEKYYYTSFVNQKTFERKCQFKIINRATYNQQESINKLKKDINEKNKKQKELLEIVLKGIYLYYNVARKGMIFSSDNINYIYIYSENGINYCINLNTYLEEPQFIPFDEMPITNEYIDDEKLKTILNYMNKNIVKSNRKNKKMKRKVK